MISPFYTGIPIQIQIQIGCVYTEANWIQIQTQTCTSPMWVVIQIRIRIGTWCSYKHALGQTSLSRLSTIIQDTCTYNCAIADCSNTPNLLETAFIQLSMSYNYRMYVPSHSSHLPVSSFCPVSSPKWLTSPTTLGLATARAIDTRRFLGAGPDPAPVSRPELGVADCRTVTE